MHFANLVLWIYIVLLLVGGLIGFLKAGSKVSLITSAGFAAALAVAAVPGRPLDPAVASSLVNILMARATGCLRRAPDQDQEIHAQRPDARDHRRALALRNIKF